MSASFSSPAVSPTAFSIAKVSAAGERPNSGRSLERRDLPSPPTNAEVARPVALLVAGRHLIRDCLARCVRRAYEMDVAEAPTVDDALAMVRSRQIDVVMLILDGQPGEEQSVKLLQRLIEGEGKPPVIVMADNDELSQIVKVMRAGARGYISTSMGLDITIEAIRLVRAGGQFLPAQSVLEDEVSHSASAESERPDALHRLFTTRQAAVVEALRKGMANKIIAYELNMQESTVKVHVRNIMKKLKARNRTEVAYLANQLLD